MGLLAWLIVGAVAGWLAGHLTGTSQSLGMNIVLGIIGGVVGGFVLSIIGFGGNLTGIDIPTIFTATLGAVLLIVLRRAVTERRR